MNPIFNNLVWVLDAPPPWCLDDCEHCIEITQPDGVGAIHISNARKQKGAVSPEELLSQLKENCPDGTDIEKVRCGDFAGYVGEYVDWHTDTFWKKWFVANGADLLLITYNCKRGEEEVEATETLKLLASLRSRA